MARDQTEFIQLLQKHEPEGGISQEDLAELDLIFSQQPRVKAYGELPSNNNIDKQIKTVYFVRHAEAAHNEAFAKKGRQAYTDPAWLDAQLTAKGKQQSAHLKPSVEKIVDSLDLVVVSPMRRALETASIAGFFDRLGKAPYVATELVRERLGRNPCDGRRLLSVIKSEYPNVDFDQIQTEEDVEFKADHRESAMEMARRGIKFLAWLKDRPESTVAVITHSAFLLTLFNLVFDTGDDLRRWFENAEMRCTYVGL